jgi:Na+/melibiose symporter-like transporter
MSLVRFLIFLGIGTDLSWAAWGLVLYLLDPQTGGFAALSLFYSSFFLAGVGTLTIVGFFLRYWLEKEKLPFNQIRVALRQGLLIVGGLIIALMLQSQRLLNLWTMIVLLLLMGVIEVFFLAGQARHDHHPSPQE